MESINGVRVYESTADQVRRALEAQGIVFINSGPHIGVMVDVSQLHTYK
jgi:3-deoxy-D-arabino-heptulosonate 7-phosphate (DAHP) synthase